MASREWKRQEIRGTAQESLSASVCQGTLPVTALHLGAGGFGDSSVGAVSRVARVLADAGLTVVSLDYPRGPEQTFPTPLNASYAVLATLRDAGSRRTRDSLLVCGEEAGGNLAAALCHVARDRGGPEIAAAVLVSPMLDPKCATGSHRRYADRHGSGGIERAWLNYLPNPMDVAHPYASPGTARRRGGLPPHLIVSSLDDAHRDEAMAYGASLAAVNVTVQSVCLAYETDWPHSLDSSTAVGWEPLVLNEVKRFLEQTLPATVGLHLGDEAHAKLNRPAFRGGPLV